MPLNNCYKVLKRTTTTTLSMADYKITMQRKFDWISLLFIIVLIALSIYSLSQGQTKGGIAGFVLSAIIFLFFVLPVIFKKEKTMKLKNVKKIEEINSKQNPSEDKAIPLPNKFGSPLA